MTRGLSVVLLFAASPLVAQQDSLMLEAVRLATEGMGDSAHVIVRQQLNLVPPMDAAYPEILYTAGVVSSSADSALGYFRRVSIEYSTSQWADRALLRIAQLSYTARDPAATVRAAERVLLDYPFSEVRGHAAFWAARARFDLQDVIEGCQLMSQASAQAGDDVELANRSSFYLQRCREVLAPGSDTAVADSADPAATGARAYAVQVAAVQSAAAADDVMRQLRDAGYSPTVIRDADGLLKVRVGEFRNRSRAAALARELKGRFGGDPFVVERP